jgi:hypothetical protein
VRVGTLNRAGIAGPNVVPFTGRIGTRPLRPGVYRLKARAVDAAGNAATPRTTRFRIVRARPRG